MVRIVRWSWRVVRRLAVVAAWFAVGYAGGQVVGYLRWRWSQRRELEAVRARVMAARGRGLDLTEAWALAVELDAARADPPAAAAAFAARRRLVDDGTAVFDGRLAVDSAAVAGDGGPRAPVAGDDARGIPYTGTY